MGLLHVRKYENKLPKGKYKVFIDSELKKGFLELMDAKLSGKSKKEIFLVVTYAIHLWQIMKYLDQFY